MNKKKVVQKRKSVCLYDILDGKNPIEAFKAMTAEIPDGIEPEDAIFELTCYGYDSPDDLEIKFMRLETDKEFEARKLKAEKAKEAARLKEQKKKERELKMLARLEEKYRK